MPIQEERLEELRPAARPLFWAAALTVLYVLVTAATASRFQGDTIDYVVEAERFDRHDWEFGHLWWVPLGWVLAQGFDPLLHTLAGTDTRTNLALIFLSLGWLSGLACVLLLHALIRRLGLGVQTATAAIVAMLFAQAFLNYLHTGCSYVPGLACALLSLYLAVRLPAGSVVGALGAGAALGAAVCFWFPYVLTVPGVLVAPLVLSRDARPRWGFVVCMALGLGLIVALAYGVALLSLGITDYAGFRDWMTKTSHGVRTRGLARAVFGLARSVVSLGDDGVLFKRYLLQDPYNPVSLGELVRTSLLKFALFYLALVLLAVGLWRSRQGWRLLLLGIVGGLPVFAFGVFWQGGDIERYLPLYPFLFLAIAWLWSRDNGRPYQLAVAGFFALMVVVNGWSLSRWEIEQNRYDLTRRVEGLRERLTPGSQVLVGRDRLILVPREALLDPELRDLPLIEVAVPGLDSSLRWRQDVAALVFEAWAAGGEVWFSERLRQPRPHPDSPWVEGDDPRLAWADIATFFAALEVSDRVGGAEGFVRLQRSPANERLLKEVVRQAPS